MTDSHALLVEYAENGTESAFRELVARYIDLVYSTALRKVGGDAHLAEDVAQTVFLHLAKKARKIPKGVMLGGWLHQATRNVAGTVTRAERRRQVRERHAVHMNALENDSSSSLDQVAPILDDAIGELPAEDRTAVLLRFFEKRDFRSVGEALGSSEDAARMRVNRALEKLHGLLKQRGVTVPVAALGAALAAEAVTAAPAGLAVSVAGSALAGITATGGITLSILKIMAMTKLKLAAIGAVVIGGLATSLVVQHQTANQLREEAQSLRQQLQAVGDAQAQPVKSTVDENELENLRRDKSELLRLRAEVAALRKAPATAALKPQATDQAKAGASAAQDAAPGVTRLQANVHTQVGTGQTLLTGGWANEPGKRVFVLATPYIDGDKADLVVIRTKLVEVPEAALAQAGLEALKVEGTESSLQQVLTADQAKQLLDTLEGTEGARLLAENRITTADGRQAEVQTMDEQVIEGRKEQLGPVINIVPVISGDKSAIDITLQARLNQLAAKTQ
jgi:RNA polymerase sigma factor (sigma-70 family)